MGSGSRTRAVLFPSFPKEVHTVRGPTRNATSKTWNDDAHQTGFSQKRRFPVVNTHRTYTICAKQNNERPIIKKKKRERRYVRKREGGKGREDASGQTRWGNTVGVFG